MDHEKARLMDEDKSWDVLRKEGTGQMLKDILGYGFILSGTRME